MRRYTHLAPRPGPRPGQARRHRTGPRPRLGRRPRPGPPPRTGTLLLLVADDRALVSRLIFDQPACFFRWAFFSALFLGAAGSSPGWGFGSGSEARMAAKRLRAARTSGSLELV